MKYTPLDVRHQEFANSTLGGYNKREVKEFLNAIADDLEEIERQNRAMQERLLQLEGQINDLRQGEESLRRVVVVCVVETFIFSICVGRFVFFV